MIKQYFERFLDKVAILVLAGATIVLLASFYPIWTFVSCSVIIAGWWLKSRIFSKTEQIEDKTNVKEK
jgi:hypothetical protein